MVGVEVGTSAGENACEVLDQWKEISRLFCIDSYPVYSDFNKQEAQATMLYCAISNFITHPRAYLILDTSITAAERFQPGTFDFAYIDANHSYDFVKQDILSWLPKIKKGGVIGGHDFDWKDTENGKEYSVRNAVRDVFGDRVLYSEKLFTPEAKTTDDTGRYTGLNSDWWVYL